MTTRSEQLDPYGKMGPADLGWMDESDLHLCEECGTETTETDDGDTVCEWCASREDRYQRRSAYIGTLPRCTKCHRIPTLCIDGSWICYYCKWEIR